MNRKNRKKWMRFHPKKGLVLGLVLSLVLSLFSFGTVFAEEEAGTEPFEAVEETEAALQATEPDPANIPSGNAETGKEPAAEEETDPAPVPAQTNKKPENEAAPVRTQDDPDEEIITLDPVTENTASEAMMQAEDEEYTSGICGPNATWKLSKGGTLTISGTGALTAYSDYKSTPWYAFYPGKNQDGVTIKNLNVKAGITAIPKYAFQNCESLETASLPAGLQRIGAAAFKGTGIEVMNFPNSLTAIEIYAFNQTLLQAIELQNTNVTEIGEGAFMNCGELKSVILNDKITSLTHTFDWDENLETVVLGKAVTALDGTFRGCASLKSVNLPASLQTIGWATFGGCESLSSLVLPASLIKIADGAFQESGLVSVTLPSKLETIGKAAFYQTKLASVTIPKSVKSIGRAAFPSGTKVTKLAAMTTMQDGSQKRSDLVVILKPKVAVSQKTARKMFSQINSFRTGSEAWYYDESNNKVKVTDLQPLKYDYTLEKIAQQRAAEIALNFSHMRPDGTTCFELTMKDDAGNAVSSVAENIISGYGTYEKAMEALKETGYLYDGQGHRRNMLSSDFKAVGIAHVAYEGKHYWVQEFGTTKSTTAKTTAQNGTFTMSVQTWTESGQINALSVAGNALKLGIGMKATVPKATVTVRFAHGKYAGVKASKKVSWTKSSKPAVAAIGSGKVAGKKAGTSVLSGTICAKKVKAKISVLKTPKLPTLKKQAKSILVKWKKVSGASKYAVFRKTGTGKWKRIAVTTSLKYVDKKVKRGKKYAYTIRCISKNKKTYESNYNKKGRKIKFS